MDYGALALVPPFVVIVLAIIMRTSFEPLLIGCLTGFFIISIHDKSNFFTGFVNSLTNVIGDPSPSGSVWVILVCGLYGSLIGLMVRSGGTLNSVNGRWKELKQNAEHYWVPGVWAWEFFWTIT